MDTENTATVTLSRDDICAAAMASVLLASGFDRIPLPLLDRYACGIAHEVYATRGWTKIGTSAWDDVRGADGTVVLPAGRLANGLLSSDGESLLTEDGTSADDLLSYLSEGGVPDVARRLLTESGDAPAGLVSDLMHGAIGATPVTFSNIPKDRPLVLFDIDDCLNVFRYDGRDDWLFGPALPDADVYEVDCEENVAFPKEVVGMRGPMGRRIPESMHVRWSSELARDVAALAEESGATLAWLSSWQEMSKPFEDVVWPGGSPFLGYREWRLRGMSDPGIYGKQLSVAELFEGDGTCEDDEDGGDWGWDYPHVRLDVPCLVVIDDKGRSLWGDFFGSVTRGKVPTLTVSPDPRYGVSRSDWAKVREFVAGHPWRD